MSDKEMLYIAWLYIAIMVIGIVLLVCHTAAKANTIPPHVQIEVVK